MLVIPMAGQSRRFSEAGYTLPKFMLPLDGGYVFDKVIGSFLASHGKDKVLFVTRGDEPVLDFVRSRAVLHGFEDFEIVNIEQLTRGQAETVILGLRALKATRGPIDIFNIDTFRPSFSCHYAGPNCAGWLEVFRGGGNNWSFIEIEKNTGRVIRTTEKVPISDLCCSGFYSFSDISDFYDAYEKELVSPFCNLGELYIAPLYNHLISAGRHISYRLIDRTDVIFCGVPEEYEQLRATER